MTKNYYQQEIETMSAEEMRKLQSEKLVKQVKHVYENVPYYRNLMDEKGVTTEDTCLKRNVLRLVALLFKSFADICGIRRCTAKNCCTQVCHELNLTLCVTR